MAAYVGGKVAAEIAKDIVPTVKRQLNYLCCFNNNVKSMTDEGELLKAKKEGLESLLAPMERSMETRDPQVAKWLTDTENILKKKENEIDVKIPNAHSSYWISIKSRFSLGKKVREITEDMEKLQRQELPTTIAHPENPARRTIPVRDILVLPSRKEIEDDIVHEVLSEQKVGNIIGIAGMGGLGKTTLGKYILNRLNKDNSFEVVAVVISQPPVNILQIQKDIGEQLGLKDFEKWRTVQHGARELHSRLKSSQDIIILMDDIWEELELKDLGIPHEGGCLTLLTSRHKEILKQMCHKVFEMEILTPEEANSLFEEKVGSSCMNDLDLGSIATEIAQECGGLPLAIVTIVVKLK